MIAKRRFAPTVEITFHEEKTPIWTVHSPLFFRESKQIYTQTNYFSEFCTYFSWGYGQTEQYLDL